MEFMKRLTHRLAREGNFWLTTQPYKLRRATYQSSNYNLRLTSKSPTCITMPNSRSYDALDIENSGEDEQSSFLAAVDQESESTAPQRDPSGLQSSISQTGAPRTPRTPNRVRFDIDGARDGSSGHANTLSGEAEEWLEEEDYIAGERRGSTGQRAPLLTDIEAPSVTAALEINVEDLLESARPKSGMSSAFMNMANSIIGAGIIGTECL